MKSLSSLLILLLLLAVAGSSQAAPKLVKDLNSNPGWSFPTKFFTVNGALSLYAYSPEAGFELWKSDGTEAGTTLLKDIYPGTEFSQSDSYGNGGAIDMGTYSLFTATDGKNGYELWRSDGTPDGTFMLRDINLGYNNASFGCVSPNGTYFDFIKTGTHAFFPVTANGVCGLWKTDGTAAGTVQQLNSATHFAGFQVVGLASVGNDYLLIDTSNGFQQQVYDFSVARSALAPLIPNMAINNQRINPIIDSTTGKMLNYGGFLYYVLESGFGTSAVYKTAVAYPAPNLLQLVGDFQFFQQNTFTVIGNFGYFVDYDFLNGGAMVLEKMDLSNGVITKVANLWNVPEGTKYMNVMHPYPVGNNIVMLVGAFDSVSNVQLNNELWSCDTTTGTLTKLAGLNFPPNTDLAMQLAVNGGKLYFANNDPLTGLELWYTDGTSAGTKILKDANPGSDNGLNENNFAIKAVGTDVYFAGNDGVHGVELWRTSGTGASTVMVKDINTATSFSAAMFDNTNVRVEDRPLMLNGVVYYPCMTDFNGFELCRTDGTAPGTYALDNTPIGRTGYNPGQLTAAGNKVYFTSWDDSIGQKQLWVTDGTAQGTLLVHSNPAPMDTDLFSGYPNYFAEFNGKLYFASSDGTNGTELWVSDGTILGTTMVADINVGSGDSFPAQLTVYNNALYFSATEPSTGNELWKTLGTSGTTTLVRDIEPGAGSSSPGLSGFNLPVGTMRVFNNYLYFGAQTSTNGRELWKTDGTTTIQAWDFNPGAANGNPRGMAVVGNTLFVRANNVNLGQELYTCTTVDSCSLVKEIYPGSTGLNLIVGTTAGTDKLYFWADDSVHGLEPWVSDGTAAGTHMIMDIMPGAASSGPINPQLSGMAVLSDGVYFGANDSVHGFELWKTDGTTAAIYADTTPGPVGGQIAGTVRELVPGKTILYFYAHDLYGIEAFTVGMGPDPLVLSLPLDGNLIDASATPNAVTGLGLTPVADRFGVTGKAYAFDSAAVGGSNIKVADAPALDTDTAFTLAAWVKVNSFGTASSALFSKWLSSASFGDYTLMLNTNGTLTFTVANRTTVFNTDNVRTTGKLPLGEWVHVAATFNAGDMKIYLNGALSASKVSTIVTATEPTEYTSDDLYLGAFYNGAFRLNGAMDEARVYNTALTATEIATFLDYLPTPVISLPSGVYAGTQTVALSVVGEGLTIRYTLDGSIPTATTGLVYTVPLKLNGENQLRAITSKAGFDYVSPAASANYTVNLGPVGGLALYLPLDGNLKDSSGNNATATTVNSSLVSDRKSFPNRAYLFNSTAVGGSNIKVLDSAALDADNTFTLGAWVKLNSYNASTPAAIFSKWLSAASFGDYTLWINPNGTVSFTVANTDTGVIKMDSVRSATVVPLNTWTHVAATFNNGIMSVYINAIQQGTFTSTLVTHAETKEYNADDLYIGALATGVYRLNGMVDEVRLYNRSLSNAEVSIMSELLPAPVMVPPPGPYTAPVNVALSSSISGFTVRYTTDGTSPTTTNGTLYAGVPVAVNGPLNITAALFFGDSKMSNDFVGRYTTSFGAADNLALYLAMDGNLNDTSGKNNLVTGINVTPTFDVWARPDSAVSLDQFATGGSRIKILDNANLDTDTAFTLSAWVKLTSYGTSNSVIFSKWLSSASAGDYVIWVNPNGTISFNVASTESGTFKIDSLRTTAKIPLGSWTHVAFTFNAGVMGIHINGSTISTKTSTLVTRTEPKEYGSDDLYIGSMYSKAYPFNGSFDEVRIYGRALAIQEIDTLRLGTTGTVAAAAPLARMAANPVSDEFAAAATSTNPEPAPGETWTDAATGLTFTYLPPSTFVMGSDKVLPECDASPAHLVSLSTGYWLAQSEVTQSQWESIMGVNPSSNPACPTCPVENVTLDEINSYLTKLSAKSGLTYQLPTEAQWEYAARSGGQATLWAGTNNQAEVVNFAWLAPNAAFTTHPVATKLANGLGLNDLNGNVAEWTRDNYLPYSSTPAADPLGTTTTDPAINVLRGGSYLDDSATANTFCREAIPATERTPAAGFRVVVGR